ncbi:MAG: hypothetical protein AAF662_09690 [Pseudomonadota bacterium]
MTFWFTKVGRIASSWFVWQRYSRALGVRAICYHKKSIQTRIEFRSACGYRRLRLPLTGTDPGGFGRPRAEAMEGEVEDRVRAQSGRRPIQPWNVTSRLWLAELAGPLVLALTTTCWAEGGHGGRHEERLEGGESRHEADFPMHTLGVFIGDTTEDRRDGATLGFEFEYRTSEKLGIGLTAEYVAGDFDTKVLALPVARHHGPWKFYAGPGFEFGEEGRETLFRVGTEYGFRVGRLEVSPQVDIDFVDGDQLFVIGVVIATEM